MKPVPPRIRRAEPDGFAPGPSVRDADVPRVHVIVTPPAPVTGAARFATTGSYVPNATEEAEIRQLLETVTATLRLAVALAPASGPAPRRAAAKAMASARFTVGPPFSTAGWMRFSVHPSVATPPNGSTD